MKYTLKHELIGHTGHVNKVTFSPDEKSLFSLGFSGEVFEWHRTSGELLCRYEGHSKSANDIIFLSKGNKFITASNDGTLRLWKRGNAKHVEILHQTKDLIQTLFLLSDENNLLFSTPKFMCVKFNLNTKAISGELKSIKKNLFIKNVDEALDCAIVGGGHDVICKISIKDLTETSSESLVRVACSSIVTSVDGKSIFILEYGGSVISAETKNLKKGLQFNQPKTVAYNMDISADGKYLAICQDHRIKILSSKSFNLEDDIVLPGKGNYSVKFSADSRDLILGSADKKVRIFTAEKK